MSNHTYLIVGSISKSHPYLSQLQSGSEPPGSVLLTHILLLMQVGTVSQQRVTKFVTVTISLNS